MKLIIVAALMALSAQSFAQTKMGPEAVEMFSVLTHPQVSDCLQRADVRLVSVEISKSVARCPGCNTYKITGHKRNIDTPSPEKTVITIKGESKMGSFGQRAQTYTCDVKE